MSGSLLLIADVGGLGRDCRWHVGDEAMLAADLAWLRRELPAADLVVGSSAPAWTRRLYGARAFQFPRAASRLRAVLTTADGVLFCGAGNLTSAFPNRLHERIVAARLAAAMAKPYAFLSQTIGPLTDTDAAQVRVALANAAFVGTRDSASAELTSRLGVPTIPMQDDAMQDDVTQDDVTQDEATRRLPAGAFAPGRIRRIGVTLHWSPIARHRLDLPSIATSIETVARECDASVRFIPHFRGPGDQWSDLECGAELASALSLPMEFVPWEPVSQVRADTAACSLVISTRYHPLVFAARAGVPAIGLYQDSYHRAKFSGVRAGRETWQRMFPADVENSDLVAATGIGLIKASPVSPADLERQRQLIEQDAAARRHCLALLGCLR